MGKAQKTSGTGETRRIAEFNFHSNTAFCSVS
jgi:hypothetical protein